ncbi:YhcN/YlaJ family sporulation lipoprotein [Clostridium lundense]|uniref:YhcN/YlaJ family sporulation lipoprotein n=1 Tax=Clostridium lundense TaxID=319475 RepID=UPI00054F5D49|nr:YhcN/YlaJ family sporulation lipoprotein [Clostridium lundense]
MRFLSNKKVLSLLLVTVFSLNISACTTKKTTPTPPAAQKAPEQTNVVQNTTTELTQRADKIAKELTTIKGVKSANVVISEERALVGINLDKNIEGKLTDNIKNEVDKKVKSVDPKIKTVATSADVDIVQRITNVGNGIRQGKPLSEFGNEVEEIFRRIMPK